VLVELGFEDIGFGGGRKTGVLREIPHKQGENQQQTQPQTTYGTGLESKPGHIGGRHHCAIPVPHWVAQLNNVHKSNYVYNPPVKIAD